MVGVSEAVRDLDSGLHVGGRLNSNGLRRGKEGYFI
jgi:hypothetical protein